MAAAFATAFAAGASRVAIIGTDCPGLSAGLRQAFEQLASHDLVLGPADDGDRYLLVVNLLHAELFANKAWSTATVLPDTLADAARGAAAQPARRRLGGPGPVARPVAGR